MEDMASFVLTCSDTETFSGATVAAMEVFEGRLAKKEWPLFSGTAFRKEIKEGDVCVIYIAGTKQIAQHFVAVATVADVREWGFNDPTVDSEDFLTTTPSSVIRFSKVARFDSPLGVRPIVESLDFTKGKKKWGIAFHGGCKRLPSADLRRIKKMGNVSI